MALKNRVRVGGSGFTIFAFMGQPLAFCQQVSHTAPAPVGPGAVAIHPMDEPYPVQVITPAAAGMGSVTLNMYELYESKVWDRVGAAPGTLFNKDVAPPLSSNQNEISFGDNNILSGAVDIADIFVRIAAEDPANLSLVKYIRSPTLAGNPPVKYHEIYHNCVITNIVDGEEIQVGTMEVLKQLTIGYTHVTRPGRGVNGNGKSKASMLRTESLI